MLVLGLWFATLTVRYGEKVGPKVSKNSVICKATNMQFVLGGATRSCLAVAGFRTDRAPLQFV